jgi:poly [ADP-ribose] polymerase
VYIGDDGTIFDASLNQTNAGYNNNKFYRVQIVQGSNKNCHCWTRWGRVGEHGQSALLGDGSLDDARKNFEKKFKDKSGHKWTDRLAPPKTGKYTFIERDYDDADDEDEEDAKSKSTVKGKTAAKQREVAESLLKPQVQELMKLIFNQQFFANTMASMDYDANKLPLGKLSKRTIQQGFQALKDLSELLVDPDLAGTKHDSTFQEAVSDLSNSYYTVIPHAFGRSRPPIINNDDMLRREIELLDSLSDMSIADEIMKEADEDVEGVIPNPLDGQYKGLGMEEMEALDHDSSEFKQLEDYMLKTHGSTHYMSFTVEEIFRIERNGERERFSQSEFGKVKGAAADRRLLWHGSRCTNFGGILSQGLRIAPPEAPVSGYMCTSLFSTIRWFCFLPLLSFPFRLLPQYDNDTWRS